MTTLDRTDKQQAILIIPNAEHCDAEDQCPEPSVEQMRELGLFGVTIPPRSTAGLGWI